jgi:hypothetical protein
MYKIIGANQSEYGPVSADQLRQWIAEGRVNAQTLAQMEGETGWRPLSEYPDFAGAIAATPPPPLPPPPFAFNAAPLDDAGRARALQQVTGPAIALLIVGILSLLACVLVSILAFTLPQSNRLSHRYSQVGNSEAERLGRTVGRYAPPIVGIFSWAFVIFGAVKMKKLQGRGLAIAASIVAMLPCGYLCCVIGLPIGIWSLVVLNKPDVKSFFS